MSVHESVVLCLSVLVTMLLCRCVPLFLLKGRELSPQAKEALNLIPPAAFAALVANLSSRMRLPQVGGRVRCRWSRPFPCSSLPRRRARSFGVPSLGWRAMPCSCTCPACSRREGSVGSQPKLRMCTKVAPGPHTCAQINEKRARGPLSGQFCAHVRFARAAQMPTSARAVCARITVLPCAMTAKNRWRGRGLADRCRRRNTACWARPHR